MDLILQISCALPDTVLWTLLLGGVQGNIIICESTVRQQFIGLCWVEVTRMFVTQVSTMTRHLNGLVLIVPLTSP